jgi:SAM-dependent methyltransferase
VDTSQEKRRELARRMLEYYRGTPSYFEEVKAVAPERPSEEEMILFRALVRLRDPAQAEPRVLELGCGRCESAPKLMQMLGGGRYNAVEASPDAVAFARSHNPGFTIDAGDIAHLGFGDDSFDIVFMNYVLEHTCEPNLVLDEAVRVLRPGGLLGMIVPVCDLPWQTPQSLRHRIGDRMFLARHAAQLWRHILKLRYLPNYTAFPLVDEPLVLARPDLPFVPDDDQVYVATSLELTKHLKQRNCDIGFIEGRDITGYVRNGRRPIVDALRTIAFLGVRFSLLRWDWRSYTSTVLIVARKQ